MWLLNFNEKNQLFVKKTTIRRQEDFQTLSLSSWGYTALLILLILGGKKNQH